MTKILLMITILVIYFSLMLHIRLEIDLCVPALSYHPCTPPLSLFTTHQYPAHMQCYVINIEYFLYHWLWLINQSLILSNLTRKLEYKIWPLYIGIWPLSKQILGVNLLSKTLIFHKLNISIIIFSCMQYYPNTNSSGISIRLCL